MLTFSNGVYITGYIYHTPGQASCPGVVGWSIQSRRHDFCAIFVLFWPFFLLLIFFFNFVFATLLLFLFFGVFFWRGEKEHEVRWEGRLGGSGKSWNMIKCIIQKNRK